MSNAPTKLQAFEMPRVGDQLEGRYEVVDMLASGGMGVILQARHLRMNRDVAIKILHPHIARDETVVARFEREVLLAQTLNHPNTIRLYDFGEAKNGLVYVVMELLEGGDLKEIIAEQGSLPMGRAVDLILQVLDGLGEAHEHDFVHRDLKPSNIFVTESRRGEDLVKILDFGIAKSLEEGDLDLTATGSIVGTAAYVAPEYLHHASPHKPADIYAVGLILLEMLTGKRAFQAATPAQTLVMQMQRKVRVPDPIADTPLGAIILRATAKDWRRRYADADAMFQDIEAIVDELPADLHVHPDQVGDLHVHPDQVGDLIEPVSPAFPTHGAPAEKQASSSTSLAEEDPVATLQTPPPEFAENFAALDAKATAADPAGEQPRHTPTQTAHLGQESEQGVGSKKGVWAAVATGVILLAGAAVWMGGDSSSPAPAEGEPAAASEAAEPVESASPKAADKEVEAPSVPVEAASAEGLGETASFSLDSKPPGAVVFDGEERLGETPLDLEFDADRLPRTLRLVRDGFEEATVEVAAQSEARREVVLEKVPSPEPAPKTADDEPEQPRRREPTRTPDPEPAAEPSERGGEKDEEKVDEFLDEYL